MYVCVVYLCVLYGVCVARLFSDATPVPHHNKLLTPITKESNTYRKYIYIYINIKHAMCDVKCDVCMCVCVVCLCVTLGCVTCLLKQHHPQTTPQQLIIFHHKGKSHMKKCTSTRWHDGGRILPNPSLLSTTSLNLTIFVTPWVPCSRGPSL
jgi:hypothetical protein